MRRFEPSVAYTVSLLFTPGRNQAVTTDDRLAGNGAWLWVLAMVALGAASFAFGIHNPELLASVWNLMM